MQMIFIPSDRKLVPSGDLQSGAVKMFRVSSLLIKNWLLKPGARIFVNRRTYMASPIAHRPSGSFQAAANNLLGMTPVIRIEYSEGFLDRKECRS